MSSTRSSRTAAPQLYMLGSHLSISVEGKSLPALTRSLLRFLRSFWLEECLVSLTLTPRRTASPQKPFGPYCLIGHAQSSPFTSSDILEMLDSFRGWGSLLLRTLVKRLGPQEAARFLERWALRALSASTDRKICLAAKAGRSSRTTARSRKRRVSSRTTGKTSAGKR